MTSATPERQTVSEAHLVKQNTSSPVTTISSSPPRSPTSPAITISSTTSSSKRKSEEPESPPQTKRRRTSSREASTSPTPKIEDKIINGPTLGGPDHLTHLATLHNHLPSTWTDTSRTWGPHHTSSSPAPDLNWRDYDALPLGAWDDENGDEFATAEEFWAAWEESEAEEKFECYETRGLAEGLVRFEDGGRERVEWASETF